MTGTPIDPELEARARALAPAEDGRPAWVFAADGQTLLWANAEGLAALGIESLEAARQSGIEPTAPAVRSLRAVAGTPLSAAGRGRIEILRINTGRHLETLVATCRPVDLEGIAAVLALGTLRGARPARVREPLVSPFAGMTDAPTSPSDREAEPAPEPAMSDLPAPSVGAAAVPVEGTGPSASETTLAGGFLFRPRSRPHRFSFRVERDGTIASLSSGLADAVGPGNALRAGEQARTAVADRAIEAPALVLDALEARRRFAEQTLLWPVSGIMLAVPVRLSAFDEDDGTLRVFGTVLTGQAQDLPGDAGPAAAATTQETQSPLPVPEPGAAAVIAAGSSLVAGLTAGLARPLPAPDAATDVMAEDEEFSPGLSGLPAVDDWGNGWGEDLDAPAARVADEPPVRIDDPADDDAVISLLDSQLDEDEADADPVAVEPVADAAPEKALPDVDRDAPEPGDDDAPAFEPPAGTDVPDAGDDRLSRPERLTFQEIARRLGARITGRNETDEDAPSGSSRQPPAAITLHPARSEAAPEAEERMQDAGMRADAGDDDVFKVLDADDDLMVPDEEPRRLTAPKLTVVADAAGTGDAEAPGSGRVLPFARGEGSAERQIIDRLPMALLVYADDEILYANRAALDLIGLQSIDALRAYSRIESLFEGGMAGRNGTMTLIRLDGTHLRVTGRLQSVRWDGQPAALLSLLEMRGDRTAPAAMPQATGLAPLADAPIDPTQGASALPLIRARVAELEAIVDLASDGVVTLDRTGEIKSLNQAAQALVGYSADDLVGRPFRLLFAEDSRQTALDYLDDMAGQGKLSLFNQGREVECLTAQGGLVPVFMTLGLLTDDQPPVFCAVLRDLSPFKQAEKDLIDARRAAERANAHKSDFLARVSHEIRTPLNAVIGFSEVMLEERFGPVGSERYRQYLRDIHTSGEHLMSLLNDLLDLSKIEAGRMDLSYAEVDLNEVVQQCLAIMQPQASQGRIIVRTSLPLSVPKVVADLRSVRQIVLNLMSNAIKFTDPGGQIIVSTLYEPTGEVSLRVRDTGRGMTAADVELALEPFRQVPTTINEVITGTGLGLPLTKALVEANKAQFALESTPGEGTLAKMTFPSQRVLAE